VTKLGLLEAEVRALKQLSQQMNEKLDLVIAKQQAKDAVVSP
jgi:hypothetical protein